MPETNSQRAAGWDDLRAEVQAFALAMENQLRANDHKPGWKDEDPWDMFGKIADKRAEIYVAMAAGGAPGVVRDKAADLANYAMITADTYANPARYQVDPTRVATTKEEYKRRKSIVRDLFSSYRVFFVGSDDDNALESIDPLLRYSRLPTAEDIREALKENIDSDSPAFQSFPIRIAEALVAMDDKLPLRDS